MGLIVFLLIKILIKSDHRWDRIICLTGRPLFIYCFRQCLSGWVLFYTSSRSLLFPLFKYQSFLCVLVILDMRFLSFAAATGLLSVVAAQADQVGLLSSHGKL